MKRRNENTSLIFQLDINNFYLPCPLSIPMLIYKKNLPISIILSNILRDKLKLIDP